MFQFVLPYTYTPSLPPPSPPLPPSLSLSSLPSITSSLPSLPPFLSVAFLVVCNMGLYYWLMRYQPGPPSPPTRATGGETPVL